MKIKQSEMQKLVETIVENRIKSLKENRDFSAARRLNHMAAETAMEFEGSIVNELKIIPPDELSPELQDAYKNIMGEMHKKVCAAVLEALYHLQKFPRVEKEPTKS